MSFPCPSCATIIHINITKPAPCPHCGELIGIATTGPDRGRAVVIPSGDGRDPNQEAARVVREATDDGNPLPPDLEAAWAEWIKGIQGVDERAKTLLRAAFEAGVEAGQSSSK